MGILGKVNILTLFPKNLELREQLLERMYGRAYFILLMATIYISVGIATNVIVGLSIDSSFLSSRQILIPIIVDACRAFYYFVLLLMGKFFPSLRLIGAWSIPLVLTFCVTEANLAVNNPDRIFMR